MVVVGSSLADKWQERNDQGHPLSLSMIQNMACFWHPRCMYEAASPAMTAADGSSLIPPLQLLYATTCSDDILGCACNLEGPDVMVAEVER